MGKSTKIEKSLRVYPDDTQLRGGPWLTGTQRIESLEDQYLPDAPRGPGRTAAETSQRLRECGERKDVDGVVSLFSEDAEFYLPVSDQVVLHGPKEVKFLLGSVFRGADFLRFHADFGDDHSRLVVYRAVVRGRVYEEALWLSFNERAEICQAVTFVRPLAGLMHLGAAIGPLMIRKNDWPAAAAGTSRFLSALASVWSFIDRNYLARLITPNWLRKRS